MSKDEAIRVLNELLLPLRLAGVECHVNRSWANTSALALDICEYQYHITTGENFYRNLVGMYKSFSFGMDGDHAELIMDYFKACLRDSERVVSGLLEDQDDTDPAL